MIERKLNTLSFKNVKIEALNIPKGWEIFDGDQEFSISRIKTASINKDVDSVDLGGFDLEAGVKDHPDHLFVKVLAIIKDEPNDNGDAFSEEELKKGTASFIGCPIFCNHANNDIEKARGKVVHAWYDEKVGGIWIISTIDKVSYPKLARGIEQGYIVGTSMGTQVHHSVCEICHNLAHVSEEYCSHIKNQKTKNFTGKVKCAYHKSKNKTEDKCPICGCKEGEEKEHEYKEAKIFEWNYGLKFIEDSFVVNPACHTCLVDCILNTPVLEKESKQIIDRARKVAKSLGEEHLMKVASTQNIKFNGVVAEIDRVISVTNKIANSEFAKSLTESIFKFSGKIEIDNLNKAMKFMEVVAKSMMAQKEQISMEYVSDIVDVLASLQGIADELVEMGYGNLPSPPNLEDPMKLSDASPLVENPNQQIQNPNQLNPATQPTATPAVQTQPSASQTPVGDIGSVTKPTFSSKKIKEFITASENTQENKTINIDINKESQNIMSNQNKTAAGDKTTEKQLADSKIEFHPRTEKEIDGVTESKEQLGGKEQSNDVDSDSPQVRKDDSPNYTTEVQLEKYVSSSVSRWDEYPEVITEKQWTEFSQAVGSVLSKDQDSIVTQGQLEDLRSHHRWTEPNVTTENQLKSNKNWLTKDNAWTDKEASAAYSKALVVAAVNALSDTIANYNITPQDAIKAVRLAVKDPQSQIKAAFITLVNGVPSKIAKRKSEITRNKYFNKLSSVDAIDALLACAGDHCVNLKSEDLIDAIRFVALDSKKMASVEIKAKEKLAAKIENNDLIVDKFASFEDAFKEIDCKDKDCKDEDCEKEKEACDKTSEESDSDSEKTAGLHEVNISLADIESSQDDEIEFVLEVEKIAKSRLSDVDAVVYSVDIDEDSAVANVTLKETKTLTAGEKEQLKLFKSQQRELLVKEAQGMGGEMGGGMGGAPMGGGTTMPQPPAGPAATVPPAESMTAPMTDEETVSEDDSEPKPPGTICPVCGSQDVDVIAGKGRCNNCTAEFSIKVQLDVTKWPGINDSEVDDGEEKNEEIGDSSLDGTGEGSGEGFEMPGGSPEIPVAAMLKLTPGLQKVASANGAKLGSVSPLTGSRNTLEIGKNEWLCLDTGRTYSLAFAAGKNPKEIFVEWRWTPRTETEGCSTCKRAKTEWNLALKSMNMSSEDFDALSSYKKGTTIVNMLEKGAFASVKTAGKKASALNEIKTAYATKVFPTNECRALIAKRFGENAIALSGPDKGKNLADCVCKQLKDISAYSNKLAVKLADIWQDKEACIDCMEDYIRIGFDMEKSASICQFLKLKYASNFELFAEELTDIAVKPKDENEMTNESVESETVNDEITVDFEDPFESGETSNEVSLDIISPETTTETAPELPSEVVEENKEHGNVTIELPLSALDAIEKAIDTAHGEDPDSEEHHDIPSENMDKNVEVELPGEAANSIENAIEPVLEDEVEEGSDESTDEISDIEDEDSSIEMEDGGDENDGDDDNDPTPTPPQPNKNKEEMAPENSEFKEGVDNMEKDNLASYMRKGKVSSSNVVNLDVESIAKKLKLRTAGESKPKIESAQDVVDGYSSGKTMGEEEKFDAIKPSVPRNKATMGEEEVNTPDGPLPSLPNGDGSMGEEKELGYTADDVNMSGGDKGAGHVKTKASAPASKTAKKLEKPKPISEIKELNIPRSNKDHKDTPKEMARETITEKDFFKNVEKGEGARIGNEVDNGSVPKATEEYTPDIPVGNEKALLEGEDNKELDSERQTERYKGTVSASGGSKSVEAEATRIAGKMVEKKMISSSQLMSKIEELKHCDLAALKQIDDVLFKVSKGLDTDSDGLEKAVIISESKKAPQNNLSDALKDLFSLTAQNKVAAEETTALDRKAFGLR